MCSSTTILGTFESAIAPLSFSPDGTLLAGTAWKFGLVKVIESKNGHELGLWQAHSGTANGSAFSPDGRILATAGGDGVHLWEVATRKELAFLRHDGEVYGVEFFTRRQHACHVWNR